MDLAIMETIKLIKIKEFLEHSHKELQRYQSSSKIIHLQQSAEKIWGAYTLLLEAIEKREIYSHIEATRIGEKLAQRDKDFKILFEYSDELHSYFYEGRRFEKIIVSRIKICQKVIKKVMRRIS